MLLMSQKGGFAYRVKDRALVKLRCSERATYSVVNRERDSLSRRTVAILIMNVRMIYDELDISESTLPGPSC
jgi:hypothetical protein